VHTIHRTPFSLLLATLQYSEYCTWYQTLRKQREASVRTQNNTRIYPVSKKENVDDFNPSVINVQLVSNQKVEEQCDVILLLDLCLTIFSLNLRNTT